MSNIHILHILNKDPSHPRAIECLNLIKPGHSLLLIENAVLALATWKDKTAGMTLLALEPDVLARGLGSCTATTTQVDYSGMVDLTARAEKVISW